MDLILRKASGFVFPNFSTRRVIEFFWEFLALQDSRERPNLLIFDISRAKGGAINLIAQQFGPDVTCVRLPAFGRDMGMHT